MHTTPALTGMTTPPKKLASHQVKKRQTPIEVTQPSAIKKPCLSPLSNTGPLEITMLSSKTTKIGSIEFAREFQSECINHHMNGDSNLLSIPKINEMTKALIYESLDLYEKNYHHLQSVGTEQDFTKVKEIVSKKLKSPDMSFRWLHCWFTALATAVTPEPFRETSEPSIQSDRSLVTSLTCFWNDIDMLQLSTHSSITEPVTIFPNCVILPSTIGDFKVSDIVDLCLSYDQEERCFHGGIAPTIWLTGLVSEPITIADNRDMRPIDFYFHDLVHFMSITLQNRDYHLTKDHYTSLRDARHIMIQNNPEKKDILDMFLFYCLHENYEAMNYLSEQLDYQANHEYDEDTHELLDMEAEEIIDKIIILSDEARWYQPIDPLKGTNHDDKKTTYKLVISDYIQNLRKVLK